MGFPVVGAGKNTNTQDAKGYTTTGSVKWVDGAAKRTAAQLAAPIPVKRDPYMAWGAHPKAKPVGADGRGWGTGATERGRFWVMVAVAVTTV